MARKLVLADMDGTLLDDNHAVGKRTIQTVEKFVQSGGLFTVATGRRHSATLECLGGLAVNAPVVCFQGSLIVGLDGQTLCEHKIAWQDAAEVLRVLEAENRYMQIYDDDALYVQKCTKLTEWYQSISPGKMSETHIPMSEYVAQHKIGVYKILVVEEPSEVDGIVNRLNEQFRGKTNAHLSRPDFIEIAAAHANKGTALEFLRSRFGIAKEDVIAIGDSMNDMPMILAAGVGVAMGNACKELKEAAGFLTDSNNDDGVAAAIEKFGF